MERSKSKTPFRLRHLPPHGGGRKERATRGPGPSSLVPRPWSLVPALILFDSPLLAYPFIGRIDLARALFGVDAYQFDVEVDVAGGIPAYHVVGLPAASVKEGATRIRSV